MVRISKQGKRRNTSPRKSRKPSPKTGALQDNLKLGFKEHANAVEGEQSSLTFIPKIR
jgi:hypothetical protein